MAQLIAIFVAIWLIQILTFFMNTQRPQKSNVWAGIFGDRIVGPLFLEHNLTGHMHLELLEDTTNPLLTDIIENYHNYRKDLLIFQQDGAPLHYALPDRQYLDQTFPDHWIGRRGTIK